MTPTTAKRFDAFVAFLVLACVGLAVVALLLARQNRALKAQLAESPHPGAPQADTLKAGDVVTPFAVVDGSGHNVTIGFGEGEAKTILLVFSSTCPACKETIPRWNAILGSAPREGVRVLAVQTDHASPATDAAAVVLPELPFPTYSQEHSGAGLMKKVPFIPATVILDAKGVVTQAWFGILTQQQEAELLRQFTTVGTAARDSDAPREKSSS